MLKVEKLKKDSRWVFKLSGTLEESAHFSDQMGVPQPEMDIFCKELVRINSIGVKAWIQYFQLCQSKGSRVRFFECSLSLIDQMNYISNFLAGGIVESICVPFACSSCQSSFIAVYAVTDLKKKQFQLPSLKCPKCSHSAVFDEIEDEFFEFLKRS